MTTGRSTKCIYIRMYTVYNIFPLQPTYVSLATCSLRDYVPTGIVRIYVLCALSYIVPAYIPYVCFLCVELSCTCCMYVQVSLYRQRELGSITVDKTDVVSGRPAGPYVGLDIAQEILFLGGLPTGVTPRGILQPGETVGGTLCIASLLCTLTTCIHCKSVFKVYTVVPLLFNLGTYTYT